MTLHPHTAGTGRPARQFSEDAPETDTTTQDARDTPDLNQITVTGVLAHDGWTHTTGTAQRTAHFTGRLTVPADPARSVPETVLKFTASGRCAENLAASTREGTRVELHGLLQEHTQVKNGRETVTSRLKALRADIISGRQPGRNTATFQGTLHAVGTLRRRPGSESGTIDFELSVDSGHVTRDGREVRRCVRVPLTAHGELSLQVQALSVGENVHVDASAYSRKDVLTGDNVIRCIAHRVTLAPAP